MLLERVNELCRAAVEAAFDVEPETLAVDFSDRFGDLAVNCFHLARTLRQPPPVIAQKVAEALVPDDTIAAAEAASGFVNLTLRRPALFEGALRPALDAPATFGARPPGPDAQKIMVEFSSPNTNKPQHLGHVRNNCLGESVSRLLEAAGREVVRVNLINDRGIHICKSMLAYQEEGGGATPESSGKKGDHFVGDFYVLFETRLREEYDAWRAANPEQQVSKDEFFKMSRWGNQAQQMLQLWENGDEETVELWRTMNGWVIDGFKQTYDALGIRFDRIYLGSEMYQLGKENIVKGLEQGVFYRRDDGAVEIDLTDEKLDKKVVLRSDGTSVYITEDLGTTPRKAEDFGVDGQVFVVGDEQIYHFKVLFAILRRLGYPWAANLSHLAYGMVHLPDGRMKSREGTVVDADDLIDEVTALARAEILSRDAAVPAEEATTRARYIGLSALKFMILGVSPQTTMTYDPAQSVSFSGDTGPYVMYAYARIRRMIEDSGLDESRVEFDAAKLGDDSEVKLALKILQLPPTVARAARDLNPSLISNYLLQLAHAYHSHNRAVKILKAEDPAVRTARLALSLATATALRRGLALLGIETVDRM